MCGKKRGYGNRKNAKSILNKMKRCGGKNLQIYPCPHCDMFHIGHRRGPDNEEEKL